jgi:tetratricopeptide (TPR) repeat protein
MAKDKKDPKKPAKELSTQKKVLFYAITFSIPVLFFVILEVSLRAGNYRGNTELFIDPQIPTNEYLIPNPNFSARYFFYTNTIPNPSTDVFLREKPENGLRIFAMGGSSAAGYPYGFNGTYSRVVNDILTDALPDQEVEIVNVGISAISSYTLYDQVDEILEQEPDAIMIYAGHNEFYGALGVGSNENLGGFPGFVRFYLKLQRFKTFLLVRTVIVESGKWISENIMGNEIDETGTLMERIINSRSIELESPKYELAMKQFDSNLSAIIERFEAEDIPVYVGSVASNLKDHSPFVNITDGDFPPAKDVYEEAQTAYDSGDMNTALEKFIYAKDLDGLKFRAPTEINTIIKSAVDEFDNTFYVPTEEALTRYTRDGIIGNDLMLEHLHPNQQGYFLIGRTFAETLLRDMGLIEENESVNLNEYKDRMYFTEFDHQVAWHRVATLKQGFPFVLDGTQQYYQRGYQYKSTADSLAFETVHRNKRWDESKVELAQYYEQTGQSDKAVMEYRGLIRNQPWNDSPYVFAARIFLDKNQFAEAEPLLKRAYEINPEDAFITKMLGAINLNKGNTQRAIQLLEVSRSLQPGDVQMLYNLSGAYGTNQEFERALEIAEEAIRLNPNFPGLQGWRQQLLQIINQRN